MTDTPTDRGDRAVMSQLVAKLDQGDPVTVIIPNDRNKPLLEKLWSARAGMKTIRISEPESCNLARKTAQHRQGLIGEIVSMHNDGTHTTIVVQRRTAQLFPPGSTVIYQESDNGDWEPIS